MNTTIYDVKCKVKKICYIERSKSNKRKFNKSTRLYYISSEYTCTTPTIVIYFSFYVRNIYNLK